MRVIGAIGGLLAAANLALAADLPMPTNRPVLKAAATVPVPIYNWTGCYVGGNFGVIRERDAPSVTLSDPTGFFRRAVRRWPVPDCLLLRSGERARRRTAWL